MSVVFYLALATAGFAGGVAVPVALAPVALVTVPSAVGFAVVSACDEPDVEPDGSTR